MTVGEEVGGAVKAVLLMQVVLGWYTRQGVGIISCHSHVKGHLGSLG